jgi:hypothetical protein
MQLRFTIDELNLLAEVLEYNDAEDLVDRVLARNIQFTSDELDRMAEMLSARDRELRDAISKADDAATKRNWERTRALLQRVLDKITEACAMA